ncbi:MAG: hypothetical protein FWH36_06310 [Lentimicrobiaceae bacterium]|nr:hypothetical protein [Lentimicrobiaceae bacterium]
MTKNRKRKRRIERKRKIAKDRKFIKLINSRFFYISLLILTLVYTHTDNVINYPLYIKVISYLIAFVIIAWIIVWRYKKYQPYYQKRIKQGKYSVVSTLIVGLFFFYLIRLYLFIPMNVFLACASKSNPIEYCEVQLDILAVGRNYPLHNVSYKFNGQSYYVYVKLSSSDRQNGYKNAKLHLRKSLFGTYYIEKIGSVP